MEIYEAIADFTPTNNDVCQNVLTFQTGDKFVAVECSGDFSKFNNDEWFGARALKNNEIGYVPTSYVQLEQTIRTIYSDEPKAKSLPTTPADEMQRKFPSQENIFMEPQPDYLLDDNSDSYYGDETDFHPANGGVDEDVLIQPKKLINPCMQSKERRDLHKELLFNHKHGKNVLKKPELEKVLQQRKEAQRIKEWDEQKSVNKRTSLELMLEERKNRLSQEEDKGEKLKHANAEFESRPEYLKVHAKIHAKVAANANKKE